MRIIQRLSYALLMLALLASVSAGQESTEEPEFITTEANITAVRIENGEIIIEGTYPDGCTSIQQFEWEIDGDTLTMTVYTERPADMMCTQAIVNFEQAIPLEDVPEGEYQLVVNGISAEGVFDPQALITCPEPDADYDTYTDKLNGICFSLPSGYRIAAADGQTTITAGAESELNPLPFLAVEFIDLTTPLETYIDEGFNDIFFEETELESGTLYNNVLLIGSNLSRIGFIQANDHVLRLINRPVEDETEESIAASDALWAIITESLMIFTPDMENEIEPTRSMHLAANQLNITVPVNWQISQQDGVTELMPLDDTETWITFQPLPDFSDVETPAQLLTAAANLIGVDAMNYETLQNDTTKGVVAFAGPEPMCQTIFIWHEAGVNQMDVSSAACNEDGSRNELVNQIIADFKVVKSEE